MVLKDPDKCPDRRLHTCTNTYIYTKVMLIASGPDKKWVEKIGENARKQEVFVFL